MLYACGAIVQGKRLGIAWSFIPRGNDTHFTVALELGRTPTQSEVFARTHTRKEDRDVTGTNHILFQDAYDAELKRLQDERQAIIDAGDPDDNNTASGPPDLREQVTLLNRELTQHAETNAQRVAAVEAVCAEKVQTLESTMQTQSQEVSDLRRAY
ncbi:hypothetical protein PIB30_071054 [Stylosanthes scabra]|uniref:Uncharacterized protein n=1 Tax=Stylosanthes scabra TaxID=79078 RepID=A0ABU6WPQ4_9FABA|nr:hypothetical protein [Stylosanthes scabra]